jgi:thiol-disulfide isomerase/thioredoxin
MAKARYGVGLVTGCLLFYGATGLIRAQAQENPVSQILQYRPAQKGVDYTTPTNEEQAKCEYKVIASGKGTGYVLYDSQKKILRRFLDTNGDKQLDALSYYKDGLEVYREIDTNFDGKFDQFRWFNSGGMKWGVDLNQRGKIDYWKMISADEAAQEAFQAMITRDFPRLHALFITESEMQALGLPAAKIERIKSRLKNAQAKFQKVVKDLPDFGGKEIIGRIESAAPQCVPGESIGTNKDMFRYPTRPILYQVSEKDHKWMNTGEMIQVGLTWRLLDVPTDGDGTKIDTPPDSELQKLEMELAGVDANPPKDIKPNEPNQAVVDYNFKRVAVLDKILNLQSVTGKKHDDYLKQKADNLADAATHSAKGDSKALDQLRQLRDQIAPQSPKSNLAAYLTYRMLWADYTPKIILPGEKGAKYQAEWMKTLAQFVQDYPEGEDTGDALWQLGMGHEFTGKEDAAKGYYKQLAVHFSQHPMAAKAEGAVRRLDLVGKALTLTGPTLSGGSFNIAQLRSKVVVVYYWASYSDSLDAEFTKLKRLYDSLHSKGLELVNVNLDDTAKQATDYLHSHPLPGTHLFSPSKDGNGMSSPFANQYGIMGLPTIFLVGKDGNVLSRNMPINDVEDAARKAL